MASSSKTPAKTPGSIGKILSNSKRIQHDTFSVIGRGKKLEFWDNEDQKLGEHSLNDLRQSDRHNVVRELHIQDKGRNLMTLVEENRAQLSRVDTEYGKTTEQTRLMRTETEEMDIATLAPRMKFNNLQDQSTAEFVGIGGNKDGTLLNIMFDPRTKDHVVQEHHRREYKSANKFTDLATTVSGYMAAGDNKGVVRLYNDIHEKCNALMSLDQFSDAITKVDISAHGEYVLWSTATYSAIVKLDPTAHWKHGAKKKPDALKLRISQEDLDKHGLDLSKDTYIPAMFDAGPSSDPDNTDIKEGYVSAYIRHIRVRWSMRNIDKAIASMSDKDASGVLNGTVSVAVKGGDAIVNFCPEIGRSNDVIALAGQLSHVGL